MSPDEAASAEAERLAIDRRKIRRLLLWLIAGGLTTRLLYFVEHTSSAFFRVPILDEAFYDSVARALALGQEISKVNPAFRPLLYPAFLSGPYRLGDVAGLPLALVAQHLLGILTAVAIALVAVRLFKSAAAGAFAGGLYLLAGPPLYFEGELLITTLFTALGALLLWLLGHIRADSAPWRWLLAGLLVGLMATARANALILALAFPIAAFALPGTVDKARRALLTAAAGGGLFAALFVGALLQETHLGRFQLLPGGGGVNLYLGNKQGADGMVPRQDRHQSYGDSYRDSVQLFAYAVYREETGDEAQPPNPADVSRFWLGRTAEEIRAAPIAWLGLMAKKTLLLTWNREIPNNKSYAFIANQESQFLGWMPVRFWLLLALAGVGAFYLWAPVFFPDPTPEAQASRPPPDNTQRSLALWLGLYLLLLGGAVILYFVNARYRLPLWPALAIFAGGGGAAILDLLRPGTGTRTPARKRRSALSAAIFIALATLSLVNWLSIPAITPHRDYFFRSLAHSLKQDFGAALADAEMSVELEPRDAAAQFQLASMALKLDHLELAEEHALLAVSLEPGEARILNQLGVILERRGKTPAAYQAYVRATEIGPRLSAAWVNAALLELRANAVKRAARSVKRAEKLGDRSVTLQCARAFLELKRGRTEFGKALLAGAIERDRDVTMHLVREHEKPLRLQWGDRARGDRPPNERRRNQETPTPETSGAESPTGH